MKNVGRILSLVAIFIVIYLFLSSKIQIPSLINSGSNSNSDTGFSINYSSASAKQPQASPDSHLDTAKKMTLEQKVRQVLICGYTGINVQDALDQSRFCGNYLLMSENISGLSINQIKSNNDRIHNQDTQTWIMIDQEGGQVTRIPDGSPSARVMGDTNTVIDWGNKISQDLKASGIDMDLAPVADTTELSPAIGDRSFADDPTQVSIFVNQFVSALQSNGIVAVIKHLPGHGRVLSNTHTTIGSLNYSWQEIQDFDLLPFVSAINNGVEVVMVGHIIVPDLDNKPATISKKTISKLREFLPKGSEIILMTDSLTMEGVGIPVTEAPIEALKAGEDMLIIQGIPSEDTFNRIVSAYNSGYLDINQLNLSVARILRVKSQFGK